MAGSDGGDGQDERSRQAQQIEQLLGFPGVGALAAQECHGLDAVPRGFDPTRQAFQIRLHQLQVLQVVINQQN